MTAPRAVPTGFARVRHDRRRAPWRAWGGEGDAGGPPRRAARASRTSSTGDLFRAAVRDALADRSGGAALHGARSARARRHHDPDAARPPHGARRGRRRDPRRVPAQPRPGRGARRRPRRARLAGRSSRQHRRADRRARPPPVRVAGSAATSGHVYNESTNPPKVPGRCDMDGSPLVQRDGRQARDDPRAARPTAGQPAARSSTTTTRPGSCAASTASSRSSRSPTTCWPPSRARRPAAPTRRG